MFGSIGDYLQPWQLLLWAVLIVIWLAGGGAILRRTMRRAGLANRKLTLGRCVKVVLLAGASGLFGAAVVFVVSLEMFRRGEVFGPVRYFSAASLAVIPLCVLAYLVFFAMLNLPAGTTLRVFVPPFGTVALAMVTIATACFLPAKILHDRDVRRAECQKNVLTLRECLKQQTSMGGAVVTSLQALVDNGQVTDRTIGCPAGRKAYFYAPTRINESDEKPTVVLCDLKGCHADHRHVLTSDGQVSWLTEAEFQDLLKQPQNAAIATALAQVDK